MSNIFTVHDVPATWTKDEVDWNDAWTRYYTLLKTMDRLGVIKELHDYVMSTPIHKCKYHEECLISAFSGYSASLTPTEVLLRRMADSIVAGFVDVRLLAAAMRIRRSQVGMPDPNSGAWYVGSFMSTYSADIRKQYSPDATQLAVEV